MKTNQQYNYDFPFHITARCINKDWFGQPLDEIWELMSNYLFYLHHVFGMSIHSFVLMINHFHLLATFPKRNLSEAMMYFLRETSRQITKPVGRINQTFGNRFHRTSVESPLYYLHAYKYVYQNPLRAGLCKSVEEYPFSTLRGLLGIDRMIIPVEKDDTLFVDPEKCLSWLNTLPEKESLSQIKKALKKPMFALPLDRSTRRPSKLENDML